ncbi:hypothetical protein E2542_SST09312 [Spatholobus suberectus]|nr:hypothetical protein E2542_SST09312 [Spatholobus suberectus]
MVPTAEEWSRKLHGTFLKGVLTDSDGLPKQDDGPDAVDEHDFSDAPALILRNHMPVFLCMCRLVMVQSVLG